MAFVLVPVTATSWGTLEYSIHSCPKRNAADVSLVFPGTSIDDMLIIPTCQRSDVDLVRLGEPSDTEKDRLLERFVEFAQLVCGALAGAGHWADYIDPCSGLPMVHQETGSVYGEVEALSSLLGYKTQNAGCCKIVLHPQWGSSVYPATIFAKAPLAMVQAAIAKAEAALRGQPGPAAD